jgi:hypothetical protein
MQPSADRPGGNPYRYVRFVRCCPSPKYAISASQPPSWTYCRIQPDVGLATVALLQNESAPRVVDLDGREQRPHRSVHASSINIEQAGDGLP